MGPAITLYDSRSRSLVPLATREPGSVSIYVCGMTVYDYCHIGHARAMLSFDMVVRHLRHRGYDVHYVRNHTDVDDKIIARAKEQGRDPLELAQFFIDELDYDMNALGLIPADDEPRVSWHIDGIITMIEQLIEKGHAYASNGSVYFSVETYEKYGELSGKKVEDLIAGKRVALGDDKRFPADFALWKAVKPGEISWKSPWGDGRPGWHIECSVMSLHHLGPNFDIHGGGIDLLFPHHENEIAQSVCATGDGFANYWMHNGHLNFGTEKMSKSLGNIVRIRDIIEQVPPEALRLLYFEAHYRSPLPYSTEKLAGCVSGLNRIYQAKEAAISIVASDKSGTTAEQLAKDLGPTAQTLFDAASNFEVSFNNAMDNDFNSAKVVGLLYDLIRETNRAASVKSIKKRGGQLMGMVVSAMELTGNVLGIAGADPNSFFDNLKVQRMKAEGVEIETVEQLIVERATARSEKNWAAADRIRDELASYSVEVMDKPEGSVWRAVIE